MLRDELVRAWYVPHLTRLTALLVPFSWLFAGLVFLRRDFYRRGWLSSFRLPVPVIVVGNITVGGTGKTPTVVALAQALREQGYRVGIISRGYGGIQHAVPYRLNDTTDARTVGDEAVLMFQRAQCPVVVCTDRVAAARDVLAHTDCNVIISDDGLQHYRLQRDIEIAIVDGERGLGNQHLLPAGPLREPRSRLSSVDYVLNDVVLKPLQWHSVKDPSRTLPLEAFQGQTVHAVAGIGHPARFFKSLSRLGVTVIPHAYNDHHPFTINDIQFQPKHPVVMTEKDAVKCKPFATENDWYLSVAALLPDATVQSLITRLKGRKHA